jgi:acyl carrier protein
MSLEISQFVSDFEELFDEVEAGSIQKETAFREVEEWSSLIALTLIAMADENYEVKLSGDDIRTSTTVEDLYNKVIAK